MEMFCFVSLLFVMVAKVHSTCYKFPGNDTQSLKYKTGLDFTVRSDFQLHFKTTAEDQLIYYTEGRNMGGDTLDYEGLYIYKDFLNYFIFNPSPYGTGSSKGGHVKTDFKVNNGTWITVEFFRNKEAKVEAALSGDEAITVNQTGMIVNGNKFVFDGTIPALDVRQSTLFIGGHEKFLGKLDAFDGYIDMFKDMKSNTELDPDESGDAFVSDECDRLKP